MEETYLKRNDDEDIDNIIDGIFGPGEESNTCMQLCIMDR